MVEPINNSDPSDDEEDAEPGNEPGSTNIRDERHKGMAHHRIQGNKADVGSENPRPNKRRRLDSSRDPDGDLTGDPITMGILTEEQAQALFIT